ncbi:glycoside hydrolase family 2 TIM barrel-domain containing protein [Salinimonas chungwhensis]|uniref:glycoside hydrolase family 2 TIM barrel-domain containing protein n=1 Tax=Salinimonas chungwhensis TaxID=265425 RepID=UPI00036619DD|nr:glycoside hydrolase family 2 TIM barrel-domain containing protein [Salinimonas chungwhensis]
MKNRYCWSAIVAALVLTACTAHTPLEAAKAPAPGGDAHQAIKTELVKTKQGYTILRGGDPYFIKGAGGRTRLAKLAEAGANSLRTWGTDNAEAVLDEAYKNGLTVMMGLRLGHERHGFDYSDKAAVAAQKERVRERVLALKDHPALLVWGIGNEVDLFYTNTDVWYAVQDIAAMIKELDPNHLVTTVTAGIDKEKLDLILARVPDIDYLSINIYGGLESLPQDLLDMGYEGPYVVTEWGPTGHWQVARTDWDVPIEQTSTQKAASYRSRYEGGILAAPGRALGSYAFLWGQKQETTPTWYGVFTEAGYPNEVVDSLYYNWNGEWPAVRAPAINALTINGKNASDSIHTVSGKELTATLDYKTWQDDGATVRWEILPESTDIKAGGDPEARPQPVAGLFKEEDNGQLVFKAPKKPGGYRLFAYVLSGSDKVATANIPFYVDKK